MQAEVGSRPRMIAAGVKQFCVRTQWGPGSCLAADLPASAAMGASSEDHTLYLHFQFMLLVVLSAFMFAVLYTCCELS